MSAVETGIAMKNGDREEVHQYERKLVQVIEIYLIFIIGNICNYT